ncbi:MAG: hypothetical protein ACRD06_04145, partial [Terriglobia bacterium]
TRMHKPGTLRQTLLALLIFGAAFGYVEAAVVVYLRELTQPAIHHIRPSQSASDLFPILTPAELGLYPNLIHTLKIELGREAATLLMLAAVALAIGKGRTESAAAFVMAFGVWDIAFYSFLRLFIHWPASLLTWDLLFLLPVPWAGPVLAPVIVSLSMILAGSLVLWRESRDRPVSLASLHWLGVLVGGFIIVLSFTWNFRGLIAGGIPLHFNWPLFAIGEALGLGAFFAALRAVTR